MKVRPLYDRVLVKRIEAEERTKGGIIIPDTAKEKPSQGKIVAVGAGRLDKEGKRVPMEVKVGERVLFGKYSGTEINIDEEEYVILRAVGTVEHDGDVLAVIED